jgi:hypothetical protein
MTMKLGLAIGYSGAHLDVPVALVQRAEELGYDSVWSAEAYGSDAITPLAFLATMRVICLDCDAKIRHRRFIWSVLILTSTLGMLAGISYQLSFGNSYALIDRGSR